MIDLPTTCGFCSCGCALYIEPKDGRVAALCPSERHPVSTGRLCIKGWNATPAVLGTDRLLTPLVRKGDNLEPASWEEAISITASAIKRISSESGPRSIGVIGSAKTTNEECYSLVKLARSVIGTPNIDGACRFYDASLIHALLDTTGVPAAELGLDSIVEAGSMLIVGANVMDQLPHVGSRIQDAHDRGCLIVVTDPRVSRLAPQATRFLRPKPGTDLVWIRALLKEVIDAGMYAEEAPTLPGFEELRASLSDVNIARAAELSEVNVIEAAEMLAENPPSIIMFGLGVLQQADSTQVVKALADLAMLIEGSVMPLRGQNNAQGACDLGLTHDFLPGYAPLTTEPGMSAVDMIRASRSGEIEALMVFGENVALSAPNTQETVAALDKVGFLAVSDLYLTETARLADVVFPACSFLEKDGTFTNIERRVQRVRKMFEPVGESRSDLEIIATLASALGTEMSDDPSRVMVEIAANVPQYSGVSYESLDQSWAEPWPVNGARPRLVPIAGGEAREDPEFPLLLIASRIHFHQQTGTMSSRSSVLAREYPETFAEMSESSAEKLGLRPGRLIRISSKSGSLTRKLALSDSIPDGCVHVPHYFGGDSPNVLACYECDSISEVPIYKARAVRVEAAK